MSLVLVANLGINAQQPTFPLPPGQTSSTAKKELSPADQLLQKMSSSRKNPSQYAGLMAELLNKYPYFSRNEDSLFLGSTFRNSSPEETKTILLKLAAETEQIPAALRGILFSEVSSVWATKKLYQESAELSQKATGLLTEANYLEYRQKRYEVNNAEQLKKDPNYKITALDSERVKKDFKGKKVSLYNTLGRSLWETGQFEQSEKAYRESFAANESKDSALGIAKTSEKKGNKDEALKFGTTAALTGMLQPAEMDYFYTLYAAKNNGKTDGVEKYLDAEYAKTYRNPVKNTKYVKTASRGNRVVLAEFFTGAGCHPCVGYDEAFEKIREDYSNKDVSLLVYHADIPINDPMSNYSEKSRENYYGINYAPRVFIDGNDFIEGEGGIYFSVPNETETGRTQRVYNTLNVELKKRLETVAEADIKLKANRKGQNASINVSAANLKNVSDDVTLHVALVENETTYSGENGFRFQILVVRSLAGDADKRVFGFKVTPANKNNFTFNFDVDDIIKRNLAYYDTSVSERREELKKKYAGMENSPIQPDYKYRRPQIDSNRLSVIAFLQDNKTKKILQSVTVNLAK